MVEWGREITRLQTLPAAEKFVTEQAGGESGAADDNDDVDSYCHCAIGAEI